MSGTALGEPSVRSRAGAPMVEAGTWSDADATAHGVGIRDVAVASVGGGLGSFALVDLLRICGAAAPDIAVVGQDSRPYARLQELLANSQVGRDDRMRSDSASRIDCPWGWPGYAWGEARRRKTLRPIARVIAEPVLAEYFTPTAGQVFDGVDRESARIGWEKMLVPGRVTEVRRRLGGGYYLVYDAPDAAGGVAQIIRARYLHLALGYSSLRILSALHDFREQHPDAERAVHAYHDHEHVYQMLELHGGTVLVRGSGITASQEIHRLATMRHGGVDIRIMHVRSARDPLAENFSALGRPRRESDHGFTYQTFVFPVSAQGGPLARRVEAMGTDERAAMVSRLGVSTTPPRKAWKNALDAGQSGRWYRDIEAEIDELASTSDGEIEVTLRTADDRVTTEVVSCLIDATGLNCSVDDDPLLAQMAGVGVGMRNPLGRLAVDASFVADRNPDGGGLYASGPITLGGPLGPVDSFWGLTEAAFRIVEDLARVEAVHPMRTPGSIGRWWSWMRGRAIP